MIPYFDMLNHNPSSKISHYNNNTHVILYTKQKINQNHEIFLNYGPELSNTKLLMLYGFVIPPSLSQYKDIHDDSSCNNNNSSSQQTNDDDIKKDYNSNNSNKNDVNNRSNKRSDNRSIDDCIDDNYMNHNYINIWVSMSNDAYAFKAKQRLLQQLGINKNNSEPFKITYINIHSKKG